MNIDVYRAGPTRYVALATACNFLNSNDYKECKFQQGNYMYNVIFKSFTSSCSPASVLSILCPFSGFLQDDTGSAGGPTLVFFM